MTTFFTDRAAEVSVDKFLFLLGSILILIGIIAISSASIEYADRYFGNPWHYAQRHSVYLLISFAIAFVAFFIPTKIWRDTGMLWLFVSIALLILVLVPGIGREIKGSQRWLSLGFVSFQPSEFAKCAMVIFLSGYLARHQKSIHLSWVSFIKPVLIMLIISILLLMEPDFGATVVIVGVTFTMLFLAGVRLVHFLTLGTTLLALLAGLAISAPYRVQRLVAYVDPWSDPYGNGFQLVQSLIAFGRGEWFGVGLGNSIQKLLYLPEAHTDFIFAIWAEESGAVGVLLVLFLYCGFIARIFWIARQAEINEDLFGAHFCNGFAVLIAGQAIINIGVTMGLLPTKGMALPYISWGGSSLLVCIFMLSIALRIHQDHRCERGSNV